MSSSPRKDRFYYPNQGSIPKSRTIYGSSFGKSELKGPSISRNQKIPGSSYKLFHNTPNSGTLEQSPRPNLLPRHTFNGVFSNYTSSVSDDNINFGHKRKSSNVQKVKSSSGLLFSSQIDKELASIDKINDPVANSVVCAGKSHLGIYKVNKEERTIKLSHDLVKPDIIGSRAQPSMFAPRRGRQAKFSTIADVKAGFQNYKDYVAICTNSTSISVFDINKSIKVLDSHLVTSLNEHKRSVNSFDFNMVQTNLIISGGQDGCAKIWDLRSNNLKNSSKCDISINTAYDSIRDIKWMPGYNFSSFDNYSLAGRSNAGYKFMSIHDSGVLLKFDLRQPQQFEKKINAHTGPGLCLNWHPNLDHVVTGGRDGKCCLWYIGDKEYQQSLNSQSFPNNSLSTTNLLAFPETTINIGSPITKLKFCPAYNEEINNSLLAISSMGDEAQVGIYSLARKYVPKYLLETTAASLGLVWWDSENIFNIDKGNRINGWDITKEPTVLDNLPKIVTTWRDIHGNGLLFLDQDEGTYDVSDPYLSKMDNYDFNDNVKALNNIHNKNQSNFTNPGFLQMGSNKKVSTGNMPISPSPNEKQSIFKINQSMSSKSLISSSVSSTPSISSSSVPPEILDTVNPTRVETPIVVTLDFPKIVSTMKIKHINDTLKKRKNNSKVLTDENYSILQESPVELFKYLARELEFSIEKEEPIGDSQIEGSMINTNNSVSVKDDNDDTQKDLMKKFGLSENGTWANLISKKSGQEKRNPDAEISTADLSDDKSIYQQSLHSDSQSRDTSYLSDTKETSKIKSNTSLETPVLSNEQETHTHVSNLKTILQEHTLHIEEKMELLVEFVSVASHNASIYASINDLMNFKIWLLIRDSILWDLKKLDTFINDPDTEKDANGTVDDSSLKSSLAEDNFENRNNLRKQSMNSNYSRLTESVRTSSFIEEHPEAFHSPSQESAIVDSEHETISQLMQQLKRRGEPYHTFATTEKMDELASSVEDTTKLEKDADSSSLDRKPIEETDVGERDEAEAEAEAESEAEAEADDNAIEEDSSTTDATIDNEKSPNGIPIVNRNKRFSFIDTFMSDVHSPLAYSEEEFLSKSNTSNMASNSLSRHLPPSINHGSPRSKISQQESPTSGASHVPFLKRLSDTNKFVPAIQESLSFDEILKSKPTLKKTVTTNTADPEFNTFIREGLDRVSASKNETDVTKCPPWNTNVLLRQIYEQAVQTGNMLLAINILLLFQKVYNITTVEVVKNSLSEFIKLLHHYELFEIATALLKYCSWDDILGPEGGQSGITVYCDKCGELIANESSKGRYTKEMKKHGNSEVFEKFGYWYCDSCKKPNSLCMYCEKPIKKLAIAILACGHEGHFECFREWFLDYDMDTCPAGCVEVLNL